MVKVWTLVTTHLIHFIHLLSPFHRAPLPSLCLPPLLFLLLLLHPFHLPTLLRPVCSPGRRCSSRCITYSRRRPPTAPLHPCHCLPYSRARTSLLQSLKTLPVSLPLHIAVTITQKVNTSGLLRPSLYLLSTMEAVTGTVTLTTPVSLLQALLQKYANYSNGNNSPLLLSVNSTQSMMETTPQRRQV